MHYNLADLFEAVADTVPDREAVISGGRRLSYAALEERANRLAHALTARGVGPGDHVGLWLYNGSEYLEGMLAAYKIRAVPVNVNYRYVADELRYLFNDADLKAVIHEPEFGATLEEFRDAAPQLGTALARGDDYEELLAASRADRDFPPRSPDDLYILYTGGTTGMPKGVLWRHEDIFFGALESTLASAKLEAPEQIRERAAGGENLRCLPASPFMHGTAHWVAFTTLYNGGTVVISEDRRFDAASLWQLVAGERVSFLVIVGDAFGRPLVEALDAHPERFDLSALRLMLSGGAILSPVVKEAFARLLPSVIVIDGLGSSETGGQAGMIGAGKDQDARPRFIANEDTTVLGDDRRPLTPGSGQVGWLARRGHVPVGYYKDPEKTAATFPEVDGVRWAVPGDMAMLEEDGTITLLGRGSVSITPLGEKVFPEEVEAALKGHPAVFDVIVVGVPDERFGERVTAVVQTRDGKQPTFEELVEHSRAHVAGYKVPRGVVFVDEIVRSPSGKPDYRWAKKVAKE